MCHTYAGIVTVLLIGVYNVKYFVQFIINEEGKQIIFKRITSAEG